MTDDIKHSERQTTTAPNELSLSGRSFVLVGSGMAAGRRWFSRMSCQAIGGSRRAEASILSAIATLRQVLAALASVPRPVAILHCPHTRSAYSRVRQVPAHPWRKR